MNRALQPNRKVDTMLPVLAQKGFKATAWVIITLIVFTLYAREGTASAFLMPAQDAAAMGMAGAFVGLADNPSAVWYNPAGITQLDGTNISTGIIRQASEATDETTGERSTEGLSAVQLFATIKLNEAQTLGLGLSSPFESLTDWHVKYDPFDANGRGSLASYTKVETYQLNTNLAYRVNDGLSISGGIDYTYLRNLTLENYAQFSNNMDFPSYLPLRYEGKGYGLGVNLALLYKPQNKLALGLSYRSRENIKTEGQFKGGLILPGTRMDTAIPDLILPDIINLGVSFQATDKLTLDTDIDYTRWSSFRSLYFKVTTLPNDSVTTATGNYWSNTWALSIGGEYRLQDHWKIRAGYVYDRSPVPASALDMKRFPDSDRQGVSFGVGYKYRAFTVDASVLYFKFKPVTVTNTFLQNETYELSQHLGGITASYKF